MNKQQVIILAIGTLSLFFIICKPVQAENSPIFQPSQVHSITIQENLHNGTSTIQVDRKSPSGAWSRKVAPEFFNKTLKALSSSKLSLMTIPEKGHYTIKLKFFPSAGKKQSWEGITDSTNFVWKTGDYAGKGFQINLNPDWPLPGRAVVQIRENQINFCNNHRLTFIAYYNINHPEQTRTLLNKNNKQWIGRSRPPFLKPGTDGTPNAIPLDSDKVSQWFKKACAVKIQYNKNKIPKQKTSQGPIVPNMLTIHFDKNKQLNIHQMGDEGNFLWEGNSFASPALNQSIKELQSLLK